MPLPPGGPCHTPALVDLHVHSTCSCDGASSIAEYARQAAALGAVEVGFCEHLDLDRRDRDYNHLNPVWYAQELAAAQAVSNGVCLRRGVEVTYQARLEGELRTWLAGHAWDYVVASVHLMDYPDGWAFVSEPAALGAYFATHSQRQAYLPYFEEVCRAARSGLGDVLGHMDVVKRYGVRQYGPFDPAAFGEEIRAVLRAAIDGGVGLEINTSGLRQSPGEPYPALTVLRWYRELGGEVLTIGSDAHQALDLGAGIAEALAMVRQAGFRAIATFEERRIRWIDL